MQAPVQNQGVSILRPAGYSLISILIVISILFLISFFFLDPVNFVSKVFEKPVASRTISEGELPINILTIKNPLVFQWRGGFKGIVEAKDDNSIIVSNSGDSLRVPVNSGDQGVIYNKVEPGGANSRKVSNISFSDIKVGDLITGEFSVDPNNRNRIKGVSFTIGDEILGQPVVDRSTSRVPKGSKLSENELPIAINFLKNRVVTGWRGLVKGSLLSKNGNFMTLGENENSIKIEVRPSTAEIYGTRFYRNISPDQFRVNTPFAEVQIGAQLTGDFWHSPGDNGNLGVTFTVIQ